MGKTIILNESQVSDINDALAMTQFKFKSNIKKFLASLLEDPVGTEPDIIFTSHGLDKNKLIRHLVDNKVITKKMTINDHDQDGNPHTAKMVVKYTVPKERFNDKLDALYDVLFPDAEAKINEGLFEHDPYQDALRIAKASPLTMGFISGGVHTKANPKYGMGKFFDDAAECMNSKLTPKDQKLEEDGGGATSCSGVDANGFGSGEFIQPLGGRSHSTKRKVGGDPYQLEESYGHIYLNGKSHAPLSRYLGQINRKCGTNIKKADLPYLHNIFDPKFKALLGYWPKQVTLNNGTQTRVYCTEEMEYLLSTKTVKETLQNAFVGKLNEAVTGEDGRKSSAVYAYAKNQNGEWCILAAKRNKQWDDEGGKMNPPMGHRHKYESAEDGAVRECEEESGIKLDKKDLVLASKESWGTNFKVYLPGKTSDYKPGEGDEENTKFRWIPMSKIKDYDWAWSCGTFAKRFQPKGKSVNEATASGTGGLPGEFDAPAFIDDETADRTPGDTCGMHDRVGHSNISEDSKRKKVVRNDEGEIVPENCTDCGAKVGTYICGEPIYKCSKCGKYFGTVPFPGHKKSTKKQ